MASYTRKNIPDELYDRLKRRAAAHRRSINSEVLVCLERGLTIERTDAEPLLARRRRPPAIAHPAADRSRLTRRARCRPAVIVVDTNVLAYLVLPGQHTDCARQALRRDPNWAAPLLWRSELRSVMAGYLRRGELDIPQAVELVATAGAVVEGAEWQPDTAAVFRLVARSRCSAYDCEFVALAQELGVPLVTSDRRILHDFSETAVTLRQFGTA